MSTKITAPVAPGDEMRAAMARVWAIYDADLEQIQVDIRGQLKGGYIEVYLDAGNLAYRSAGVPESGRRL